MSIAIPIPGDVATPAGSLPLDTASANEVTVANAPELIAWFTGKPHYRDPVSGMWWDRKGVKQHPGALSRGFQSPLATGSAMYFDGEHSIDALINLPVGNPPANTTGAYTFFIVLKTQTGLTVTSHIWGCPNQALNNGATFLINPDGNFVWTHANPTYPVMSNLAIANDRNYMGEKLLARGSVSNTGTAVLEINGVQDGGGVNRVANSNIKIYIGSAAARNPTQHYFGLIYELLFFTGDIPVSNPALAATTETMLATRQGITLA